jgi:hypothetical protein
MRELASIKICGYFASKDLFQFGLDPLSQETTILHLNVRPINGVKMVYDLPAIDRATP